MAMLCQVVPSSNMASWKVHQFIDDVPLKPPFPVGFPIVFPTFSDEFSMKTLRMVREFPSPPWLMSQPPLGCQDGNGVEVGAAELRLRLIPGVFFWG